MKKRKPTRFEQSILLTGLLLAIADEIEREVAHRASDHFGE